MAGTVPLVVDSQPAAADDVPLLGHRSCRSSDKSLTPFAAAHWKRLAALLDALWDSGVACVCGAALVFSFAAFFVKLIGSALPVFQIVVFRSIVSFTICAIYARFAGITPLFGRRANLRFLISRGIFGASAMTTYYFSIKMLPLADAVTIFFLNPAITAVAAWAIMREPLGLRGLAGVIISLGGLLLLTHPPFLFGSSPSSSTPSSSSALHGDGSVGVSTAHAGGWDEQRLLGSMFGLLSAILSAGAFISIRYIGKSEPALVVSVYFHVCAAASSIGPLAAGLPAPARWPSGGQWVLLLGIAGCSFWGQILIGRSFQLLHAARASAINLMQVVYSYLLGLVFLHEQLTLLGGAGSALIGAGAVLVNLRPKPKSAAAPVTVEVVAVEVADASNLHLAEVVTIKQELQGPTAATTTKSGVLSRGGGDDDVVRCERRGLEGIAAVSRNSVEMTGIRAEEWDRDGGEAGRTGTGRGCEERPQGYYEGREPSGAAFEGDSMPLLGPASAERLLSAGVGIHSPAPRGASDVADGGGGKTAAGAPIAPTTAAAAVTTR